VSTSTPLLGGLRVSRPFPERTGATGSLVYRLITITDHKVIGIMYVVGCFTFFFVGAYTLELGLFQCLAK
jgi:cytochrome c oxidase subunit 1